VRGAAAARIPLSGACEPYGYCTGGSKRSVAHFVSWRRSPAAARTSSPMVAEVRDGFASQCIGGPTPTAGKSGPEARYIRHRRRIAGVALTQYFTLPVERAARDADCSTKIGPTILIWSADRVQFLMCGCWVTRFSPIVENARRPSLVRFPLRPCLPDSMCRC
jgi:hypothetical protein